MVEEAEKDLGKHLIKTACFSLYSGDWRKNEKTLVKTASVSPYGEEALLSSAVQIGGDHNVRKAASGEEPFLPRTRLASIH